MIRHPEPLRLADISQHPRSYGFPPQHPPMTTFLGAPVLVRGEAWGNIYLTEKESGEFDEADEQALLVLARWVAIAIENAHLYEDIDARRGELERAVSGLEATVAITRAVGGETDLSRVLELVGKRGRALVDAREFLVLLAEDAELVVAAAAGEAEGSAVGTHFPVSQTALRAILRNGHAERLTAVSNRVRLGLGHLGGGARVAMLVPLMFHGRGVGVLVALDRFDSSTPFSAEDERLMRAFAGSAATALATAQNVEEEQLRMSIASADQERGRWARELHDETLQGLGALQVILTTALNQRDPEAVRAAAEQAISQIETQIVELQGLITELRPAALDDIGREPALSSLFERTLEAHGVTVASDVELDVGTSPEGRLEPEIEGTVYRLVQEALSNIAKHAETDQASVRVIERDGQIDIEVRDQGRGFNPKDPRRGFGLLGMRERVELAGGALEVSSEAGIGTRVSARLPGRHLSRGAPEPDRPRADVA